LLDKNFNYKRFIDDIISSAAVVAFGKSFCPQTKFLKKFFFDHGMTSCKFIDMDQMDKTDAFHETFKKHKGHETIPILYMNGSYAGNYWDIKMNAHNGELKKQLLEIGIETTFYDAKGAK
jgi:glutaredoxin